MSKNKIIPYSNHLKNYARELRKNPTKAEKDFWELIRNKKLGVQFHRQVPIDKFIVDFYCHELLLALELDGNSHYSDEAFDKDKERDKRLKTLGVTIVRYTDTEVFDDTQNILKSLKEVISNLIKENTPEPPQGG